MSDQPSQLDVDARVTCNTCTNLRGGWCSAAKHAGLMHRNGRAEISQELANLRQHCPAHNPRPEQ